MKHKKMSQTSVQCKVQTEKYFLLVYTVVKDGPREKLQGHESTHSRWSVWRSSGYRGLPRRQINGVSKKNKSRKIWPYHEKDGCLCGEGSNLGSVPGSRVRGTPRRAWINNIAPCTIVYLLENDCPIQGTKKVDDNDDYSGWSGWVGQGCWFNTKIVGLAVSYLGTNPAWRRAGPNLLMCVNHAVTPDHLTKTSD